MLLAKHAQHVVLIHSPIALFIMGVTFDLLVPLASAGVGRGSLLQLVWAVIFTVPTVLSGLTAWQWRWKGTS